MYDEIHSRFDPDELQIERMYLRLSALDAAPVLDAAFADVLRLLADVTRCDLVYAEIGGYWLGHAAHALAGGIRTRVSREAVERAIAERATVEIRLPGDERRWRASSPGSHRAWIKGTERHDQRGVTGWT